MSGCCFWTSVQHSIPSSVITLSTGSPQGCVLSPLLFTWMTHNCVPSSATNHIVKFADDTTVVGLIRDNDDMEVEQLVDWCRENNLILNVDKTKEIIVDFRKKQSSHAPLLINNMEVVNSTKLLGVHITDQTHLVCEHRNTGEVGTAAALPAANEEISSAPAHLHHLLQEHHREHPDQLPLCVVWRLQGL